MPCHAMLQVRLCNEWPMLSLLFFSYTPFSYPWQMMLLAIPKQFNDL